MHFSQVCIFQSSDDTFCFFLISLFFSNTIFTGGWQNSIDNKYLLYNTPSICTSGSDFSSSTGSQVSTEEREKPHQALDSANVFRGTSSNTSYTRKCKVCMLEGRNPTQRTDYCEQCNVCLCKNIHTFRDDSPAACTEAFTCWDKFHGHYNNKPWNGYNRNGSIKRRGPVWELWKKFNSSDKRVVRSLQTSYQE